MAKKKRRNRRLEGRVDGAPDPDGAQDAALATARGLAERRTKLLGELIRYAVISGLLLVFAPGLGAIVAFFWGIGLARRVWVEIVAPSLERRWTDRALEESSRDWRSLGRGDRARAEAPSPVPLRPGELVEGALRPRAERLAQGGVALRREGTCEALVKGDAELLARAVGALFDAALEDAEARSAPRQLAVELGESLAGSEVFLRLRSHPAGAADGPASAVRGNAVRGNGKDLGAVRRIVEAHGGRLEAAATDTGLELLLTLPSA